MLQIYHEDTFKSAKWNGYVLANKTILLTTVTTPVMRIPIKTNANLPLTNGGKPINIVVASIKNAGEWTFFIYDDNVQHAVQAIKDFIILSRLHGATRMSDVSIVSKNTLKAVSADV